MWTLIFIILLILGIWVYLFFYNRGKRGHPIHPGKRRKELSKEDGKTDHRYSHRAYSKSLTQNVILEDTGMLIPELVSTDQSENLKGRIQEGMNIIFSAKPVKIQGSKKTLQVKDIDPKIMEVVLHHIGHLKEFKETHKMYKILDDPHVNLSQLSKLIITDPLLSGKILKVANSAYFGLQEKVNSIGHALIIIGMLNLKNILYQEGLLKLLNGKIPTGGYALESLWEHSILTSTCSSLIHSLFSGLDKGTLFTMGLLHDIGKIVIAGLERIKPSTEDFTKISLIELNLYEEDEFFGINHAVIGRLAFEEWGYSDLMVRTVEMHHAPSLMEMDSLCLDGEYLKYLLALFLSDQLAKLFASEESGIFPIAPLAHSYYSLVDRRRLQSLILDASLFSEIKKAKALIKIYG